MTAIVPGSSADALSSSEPEEPAPVEPWDLLEEEPRGQFRVFSVQARRLRSPRTRQEHEFYVIQSPDWVNVIPLTPEGEVVLVRQFRHGTREITLEVPGGMIDPGELPHQAAARELLEETGYSAESFISLGYIHPNPAIQSNRCFSFLARGARRVAPQRLDGTEEIDLERVPRAELPRLVATGAIRHSLVVVALYSLELFERGLLPPGPDSAP